MADALTLQRSALRSGLMASAIEVTGVTQQSHRGGFLKFPIPIKTFQGADLHKTPGAKRAGIELLLAKLRFIILFRIQQDRKIRNSA